MFLSNKTRRADDARAAALFAPKVSPQTPPDPARRLPLFACAVAAGFPSPAEDYVEGKLDLNEHLIRRPAATFIVRVEGESMTGAGILPGDLLVVDRSLKPKSGDIVIAAVGGELTVKRLARVRGGWVLRAENPDYPAISLNEDGGGGAENALWGVVTSAIHRFSRR